MLRQIKDAQRVTGLRVGIFLGGFDQVVLDVAQTVLLDGFGRAA